jgi:uncharacterized Zn finger protein
MIMHVEFTCPRTGKKADVLFRQPESEGKTRPYQVLHCPVCGQFHSVNPQTGEVLGKSEL